MVTFAVACNSLTADNNNDDDDVGGGLDGDGDDGGEGHHCSCFYLTAGCQQL